MISRTIGWLNRSPGKAGAIAGWYQQFASGIITLALIPLIVRKLSPENSGLWFSFQSLANIVGLTDFGVGFVLARQVAFSIAATGDKPPGDFLDIPRGWEGINRLYAACRGIFSRIIFIAIGILIFLHEMVLPHTKLSGQNTLATTVAFYLLGASTIIFIKTRQYQALLDGLGRMYMGRFLAGCYQFLSGIMVMIALLAGGGLLSMAFSLFALSAVFLIVLRRICYRVSEARLDWGVKPDPALIKSMLKVSAPMGIVSISGYCVSAIQSPLIGSILGPAFVAPYYAAQKIGDMLCSAVSQLISPQLPLFTASLAAGNITAALIRLKRTIAVVSTVAFLTSTSFFLFSPVFANFWLGKGHYINSVTLGWLALNYFLGIASVAWGQFVFASGINPFMWTTILMGALNLLGCFVLGTKFGTAGIAASLVLAGLMSNTIYAPYRGILLLKQLTRKITQ